MFEYFVTPNKHFSDPYPVDQSNELWAKTILKQTLVVVINSQVPLIEIYKQSMALKTSNPSSLPKSKPSPLKKLAYIFQSLVVLWRDSVNLWTNQYWNAAGHVTPCSWCWWETLHDWLVNLSGDWVCRRTSGSLREPPCESVFLWLLCVEESRNNLMLKHQWRVKCLNAVK